MRNQCTLLILTICLVACAQSPLATPEIETTISEVVSIQPTVKPTVLPNSAPDQFRVIAYVTPNIIPQTIPYERLTHINYAFLIPHADGTFARLVNDWKLEQIVRDAHAADVQVLISVGGWGWEKEFEEMAADPISRTAFVTNLKNIVDTYELDGADVDWEYPLPGQSANNYLVLMTEIHQAMPDKLLTTAVVSHGANAEGIADAALDLFDFVNVMTYDGPNHGTMAQYHTGLDYWREIRDVPAEKIVMGIPFYARPSQTSYNKLVEANPEAAFQDSIDLNGSEQFYNGIPSVQDKTVLALNNAGGIMFWTLDYDAQGDYSLLTAIDEIVQTHD